VESGWVPCCSGTCTVWPVKSLVETLGCYLVTSRFVGVIHVECGYVVYERTKRCLWNVC